MPPTDDPPPPMHSLDALEELGDATAPPLRSAALEGVGGRLKDAAEDFRVDEIPAYAPDGAGDHLFVRLEKRGIAHAALLRHLRDHVGVSEREVGWAGIKDAQAVTRQWISLPARVADRLSSIEGVDGVRVLDTDRHRHALKRGHHHGNRFVVVVRGTACGDPVARALAITAALAPVGFPNYFGPQRFARGASTLRQGFSLLARLGAGRRVRRSFSNTLALQSVQSWLFNRAVARRLADGALERAVRGDILKKRATGGLFVCEEPEVDSARVAGGEVAPTGPIFGAKMWWPEHEAGAFERALLSEAGLDEALLVAARKLLPGSRRPATAWPNDLRVTAADAPDAVELSFTLPKGCYATSLLREIMEP